MVLFYISLDIYSLSLEVSIQYKISALISALIIAILLQNKLIIPFLFQTYFIWLFQSIPDWQVSSILSNTDQRLYNSCGFVSDNLFLPRELCRQCRHRQRNINQGRKLVIHEEFLWYFCYIPWRHISFL